MTSLRYRADDSAIHGSFFESFVDSRFGPGLRPEDVDPTGLEMNALRRFTAEIPLDLVRDPPVLARVPSERVEATFAAISRDWGASHMKISVGHIKLRSTKKSSIRKECRKIGLYLMDDPAVLRGLRRSGQVAVRADVMEYRIMSDMVAAYARGVGIRMTDPLRIRDIAKYAATNSQSRVFTCGYIWGRTDGYARKLAIGKLSNEARSILKDLEADLAKTVHPVLFPATWLDRLLDIDLGRQAAAALALRSLVERHGLGGPSWSWPPDAVALRLLDGYAGGAGRARRSSGRLPAWLEPHACAGGTCYLVTEGTDATYMKPPRSEIKGVVVRRGAGGSVSLDEGRPFHAVRMDGAERIMLSGALKRLLDRSCGGYPMYLSLFDDTDGMAAALEGAGYKKRPMVATLEDDFVIRNGRARFLSRGKLRKQHPLLEFYGGRIHLEELRLTTPRPTGFGSSPVAVASPEPVPSGSRILDPARRSGSPGDALLQIRHMPTMVVIMTSRPAPGGGKRRPRKTRHAYTDVIS